MTAHHLAQLNIGRILGATPDDPRMADFMAALDEINALAEASPGFVWRLQDEAGNATAIHAFDDPRLLLNMSVWRSLDALAAFTYKSAHTAFLKRRREWFEPLTGPHLVLWWIAAGHLPSIEEARDRLAHLERHGPSARAFTFRDRFPPPAD